MSESCCSSSQNRKPACTQCGQDGLAVDIRTIKHHLASPWQHELEGEWGVCENSECEVIYFSAATIISLSEIREMPAFKQQNQAAVLCNCFGIALQDYLQASIQQQNHIQDWVKAQTRDAQCACDVRNPAGRCCLKDFKKLTRL